MPTKVIITSNFPPQFPRFFVVHPEYGVIEYLNEH